MKLLDLCSGLGGFSLAARWAGWQTVGFAEIDLFCSRVLSEHWPGVPNYGNLAAVPDGIAADVIAAPQSRGTAMKIIFSAALAALLAGFVGGCAFMSDVMYAEGEYAHRIGDAFKRQGARREAAKARANKAQAAQPKTGAPLEN